MEEGRSKKVGGILVPNKEQQKNIKEVAGKWARERIFV